jgi:hypothetical protein
LKYFGKTTKNNPQKYMGSGKYWKRHIHKHGNDVSTEIIGTFNDILECKQFALDFSIKNNIVDSELWANLQEENGTDGAPSGHIGHKFTNEQKEKISKMTTQMWENESFREEMCIKQKQSWTEERRLEQSIRLTGKKRPEHSAKMRGHIGHTKCKGVKKPIGHGEKVSAALKGKSKSDSHKLKLSKPK